MKEQIISILSSKIKKSLVIDLVNIYEEIKNEFICGNYEETQSKSGKFVENVFRVLHNIRTGQVLTEIKSGQMDDISKKLLSSDGSKYAESIRILIPKIARAMIYEPRSKLGSVHVKSVTPDFIDAKLTVDAADWILAEFLRQYDSRDTEKVNNLLKNIVKEYNPIIQKIGDEVFVNRNVKCGDEILVRLHYSTEGFTRKEFGISLKDHFSPSIVTKTLKKMQKDRDVFLTKNGKYIIADSARKKTGEIVLELSKT